MDLSTKQKAEIFDRIFKEYVTEHGLGGMSKADFDALFLWLVVTNKAGINSFKISNTFKIKESRIKSLLETAAVKFDKTQKHDAWQEILKTLSRVEFDIESLEKGQIRFQLKNPMLFRWIQEEIRNLNSTCTYHRGSEQITMNLNVLYSLFEHMWEEKYFGNHWTGNVLKRAQKNIRKSIGNIGRKIEKNALEELREMKRSKLRGILETGAKLESIGSLIIPLLDKINS